MEVMEKTIKEEWIDRFKAARNLLGSNWRIVLADSDPFFNTREGANWMNQAAGAASDSKRMQVDRIRKITVSMERAAGIEGRHI